MLPKNPNKNKHGSKCIVEESNNNNEYINITSSPKNIPNVLPPDQFFTLLKEHQSSIINIETRLKSIQNNKNMNRNLAEEIDYLKSEMLKKQNSESEILIKSDMNKQSNEIKKLKDEMKLLSEVLYKPKFNNNSYSKE